MKTVTTISFLLMAMAATAQQRSVIQPSDIQWNPSFRSVTDDQIKLWNRQTIIVQGSGIILTQINDSTVSISATGVTTGSTPTLPTNIPATSWIVPANQKIGVMDLAQGQFADWLLGGTGNMFRVEYGKATDGFSFHGWGFRNAPFSFGPAVKVIAVEPSKPALVLEASPSQSSYLFVWTSAKGDTLGGVNKNGDFILKKPLPQYSGNAAAKAAGLEVGRLYQTGDYLKARY